MPKVKESNASASATSKEAEAAAKASRLKIVESQIPQAAKVFTAAYEANKKATASMFDCLTLTRSIVDKHSFDANETKKLLTGALAKAYCDGDEAQVSMAGNATAYSLRSKFQRLLFPATPKAAKELAKALDKGVDFNEALLVARGAKTAAEAKKKGKKGGARQPNVIETSDEFGDQFSVMVKKAWNGEGELEAFKGGLSLEEIQDAVSEVLAGYQAKIDEPKEDAEKSEDSDE